MDAINLGLGTPEDPFDFDSERIEIVSRITAAIASNEVPPHLRSNETTKRTIAGRNLGEDELLEVSQYDDYVQKLYDTREWRHTVQLLRDRLVRLPPQFNTYKMLIHAEANCGALDMAAKHAKEAYNWDPLMGEAYVLMAKLDCMAMQPERAEAWLELAAMVPGNEEEYGAQVASTRAKITELRGAMNKMLGDVTHLFCLPDFWVRLSKNVEYYRTFASEETRAIVSEIQRDPTTLRKHLKHDKIQWLVSMLSWTSAPLTYSPPTDEQLSIRLWRQSSAARTSKLMALPIEVILHILNFVDPPSLGRLPSVCSFWKDLLTNDHRVWKRLYLNMWDPPIIYHVPDWLWIHAFRQRYGLCLTMSRIWNRRNGDYSPTRPGYEHTVRNFLSKFSFISPSFSDSLSLIPDFIYGNVNHNQKTITGFHITERETNEAWPSLSPQVLAAFGPSAMGPLAGSHTRSSSSSSASSSSSSMYKPQPSTPSKDPNNILTPARSSTPTSIPTSAKPDPQEEGFLDNYFSQTVLQNKSQPEPVVHPMRQTVHKSLPIFSIPPESSQFDSVILNLCYFVLSKTDYGDETQQAAKALSSLCFHNPDIAHHLIQLGAIEHFSQFALSDQYGEAADLVASLLLHKHGIIREASESALGACKIFPRLWALNVVQDLKDVQHWIAGLSGVWRGRFFLGTPGYDTPFVEHFLYLNFHTDMNFGHFVPMKDLKAAVQDFQANGHVKPEYKFTSSGYIPPGRGGSGGGTPGAGAARIPYADRGGGFDPDAAPVPEEEREERELFEGGDNQVQEGECRITGSGIDDFGPYKVFGRLNVVYKTVYLAKCYEFEPTETKVVYLGGDLGIWGMGGALKTILPRNGVWKWWKDATDYTLEQMHEMRQEAEHQLVKSVAWHKNRSKLRLRLRQQLTAVIYPNAPNGILIGDEGFTVPAHVPQNDNAANGNPDVVQLRHGLRWAEMDFPIVDALIDPVPPPFGPDISQYNNGGAKPERPRYLGYVPASLAAESSSDQFVWHDTSMDCGPTLTPIYAMEDEAKRVLELAKKPVSAFLDLRGPNMPPIGHCDCLARLISASSSLFQLEHISESMHSLQQFEQYLSGIEKPSSLKGTPPLRRFHGESDDAYTQRRMVFSALSRVIGHERKLMIGIHEEQAKEDSAYLLNPNIPWNDPKKLLITHRWVDDWLRHSVRMYITDQATLQRLLGEALHSPSSSLTPIFFAETLNEETEGELVARFDRQMKKSGAFRYRSRFGEEDIPPGRHDRRFVGEGDEEDGAEDGNSSDSNDEDDDASSSNSEATDEPIINTTGSAEGDHSLRRNQEHHHQQQGTVMGWIEAGIALLTVGLALVVGIRFLAARNRR